MKEIKRIESPKKTARRDMLAILDRYKLSLKRLCELLGIPYRTAQNWLYGATTPPDYIINLIDITLLYLEEKGEL